jgi:hypothetical protein
LGEDENAREGRRRKRRRKRRTRKGGAKAHKSLSPTQICQEGRQLKMSCLHKCITSTDTKHTRKKTKEKQAIPKPKQSGTTEIQEAEQRGGEGRIHVPKAT